MLHHPKRWIGLMTLMSKTIQKAEQQLCGAATLCTRVKPSNSIAAILPLKIKRGSENADGKEKKTKIEKIPKIKIKIRKNEKTMEIAKNKLRVNIEKIMKTKIELTIPIQSDKKI
jgi:hypothetical protein